MIIILKNSTLLLHKQILINLQDFYQGETLRLIFYTPVLFPESMPV